MSNNYSSYRKGLKVGDFVTCKYSNHKFSLIKDQCIGIVLERKYLFENSTKWGLRKFYEYEIYTLNSNIIKISTQNMKVLNRKESV